MAIGGATAERDAGPSRSSGGLSGGNQLRMSTEFSEHPAPAPGTFDSLEARLERQTLMATIATRFISVPAEEIATAIAESMSAIGRYAGLDRVALAIFDDKYERWSIDHDWFSPGLWSLKG